MIDSQSAPVADVKIEDGWLFGWPISFVPKYQSVRIVVPIFLRLTFLFARTTREEKLDRFYRRTGTVISFKEIFGKVIDNSF